MLRKVIISFQVTQFWDYLCIRSQIEVSRIEALRELVDGKKNVEGLRLLLLLFEVFM
jgi:hypothetical protein